MKTRKFTAILIIIIVTGLVIWAIILGLTWGVKEPNPLLIDLGKSGVSLTLVSVVGGMIQWALKRWEAEKQQEIEKREFYKNVLNDLKTVYDKVERARLLIEAHRTAKTYGEEMRSLIGGVVTLHTIKRAFLTEFPQLALKLKPHLDAMNGFIKDLLNEYRDNYKLISVLQEIDEVKKDQLKQLKLTSLDGAIEENEVSASAWQRMKDLKHLRNLINNKFFEIYEVKFLNHLDNASAILRARIPVKE